MDNMVLLQTKTKAYLPPVEQPPQPYFPPPPHQPLSTTTTTTLDNRISPSILLIIAILAVIFFLSGLLHLLIRYLLRPTARDPDDQDNVTALQGQLQQLFHLHDAGVDQSFIDTLPVFLYKAIVGAKDPFDCAVCLCEFEAEDKLRLLPKCSHAFHLECIDTWLLSHSTCPLCRSSLLPNFSPRHSCSPLVLVLESGSDSSREIVPDHDFMQNSLLGNDHPLGSCTIDATQKAAEAGAKEEEAPSQPQPPSVEVSESKVVAVKLGKFRNLDVGGGAGGGEESSSNNNSNIDERRCFSMGSFEYVMDESSILQVAIKPPVKKPGVKKPPRRLAMSECDCHSQREGFRGFDPSTTTTTTSSNPPSKRESFSISKTWLRSKKTEKPHISDDGSRRAFSFRLPTAAVEEVKPKLESCRRTCSEFDSGSEFDMDVEVGSCNNNNNGRVLSRREEMPSFARRTVLWVMGRNHKVVNHI